MDANVEYVGSLAFGSCRRGSAQWHDSTPRWVHSILLSTVQRARALAASLHKYPDHALRCVLWSAAAVQSHHTKLIDTTPPSKGSQRAAPYIHDANLVWVDIDNAHPAPGARQGVRDGGCATLSGGH